MTSADDDQRKKKPRPGGTADPTAPHIPTTPRMPFEESSQPTTGRIQTWACLTWFQRGKLHFHGDVEEMTTLLEEAIASSPSLALSMKRVLASCPLPNPVLECRWALCEKPDPGPASATTASSMGRFPTIDLTRLVESISIPVSAEKHSDPDTVLIRHGSEPTDHIGKLVVTSIVLRHGIGYPLPMQTGDSQYKLNTPNPAPPSSALADSLGDYPPLPQVTDADRARVQALFDAQAPEELYATGTTPVIPSDPEAANRAKFFRFMMIPCSAIVDGAIEQSISTYGPNDTADPVHIRARLLRDAYADWRAKGYPRSLQSILESIHFGIQMRQAVDTSRRRQPPSSPS